MGKINWGRVFLCGILTGVVWGVLVMIVLPLFGRGFLTALELPYPPTGGILLFFIIAALVTGIWALWLYAAIRPRYGPGPKTAAVAGFALWIIASMADAAWASFGTVPWQALVAPVAAGLPMTIVAVIAGAWLYKE